MGNSRQLTLQYTVVSLLATAADFIVFMLLSVLTTSMASVATFFSMLVGTFVSWFLHQYWVFLSSKVENRQKKIRYVYGILLSMLLNVGMMSILADAAVFPRLLSRVISAMIVGITIYWFNRNFVFKI
jgi:putative flippase GtrA